MASRKARAYLASIGMGISHAETAQERSNFSVGRGSGSAYAMPYHVIRFRHATGNSKETVGWAKDKADAIRQRDAMRDAHRADDTLPLYCYYIRNIVTGHTY